MLKFLRFDNKPNKRNVGSLLKQRRQKRVTSEGKNLFIRLHGRPNFTLIFLVAFMSMWGLLMIYSASSVLAYQTTGDSFYYFKLEIIALLVGVFAGYLCYLIPMSFFRKISVLLVAFGVVLLIFMLPEALFKIDLPIVTTVNGGTRWLDLGPVLFQPSEYMKFALVIYTAAWLTRDLKKPKGISESKFHLTSTLIPFCIFLFIFGCLLIAQRDLDTTTIVLLTIVSVYFVAGKNLIHNLGVLVILILGSIGGSIALFFEAYRRQRYESYWNLFLRGEPSREEALGASFQVWNGLIGLGSGALFGKGYGESRIKHGFLQSATFTDSIVVIIGEEFGFIGVMLVVGCFYWLASVGYNIALKAKSRFEGLVAVGMTSWLTIQAFLNLASNLAVIPFGGIPLPFFSYGGTQAVLNLMAIGILLNVSKDKGERGSVRERVKK